MEHRGGGHASKSSSLSTVPLERLADGGGGEGGLAGDELALLDVLVADDDGDNPKRRRSSTPELVVVGTGSPAAGAARAAGGARAKRSRPPTPLAQSRHAAGAAAAAAAAAPTKVVPAAAPAPRLDLRSDSVTQPTSAMRVAMFGACVGDDIMGEDPTVARLEAVAAAFLGFEASLFCASGTMANLLAVMVHCDARSSEMVVGDRSHMLLYEQGSAAHVAGVHTRTVRTDADGTMPLRDLEESVRVGSDPHFPVTRLVCVENSHNALGGRVLPVSYLDAVAAMAARRGVALHCDGARLCNAAAALGVPPARLVRGFSSVSLSLCKGLAAPVGAVLAGSAAFVRSARRLRKALGGGWRQAGVLAACGLVALSEMAPRVGEDNRAAALLARRLSATPGVESVTAPETNIVSMRVDPSRVCLRALELALLQRGVVVIVPPTGCIRLVTHYQVRDSVGRVGDAFAHALRDASAASSRRAAAAEAAAAAGR